MKLWVTIFLLFDAIVVQKTTNEIVRVNVSNVVVQAGKQAVITIEVEVKEGYHIQAHNVQDEFIVPTTLEITTGKELAIGKHVYPKEKKFRLEGTDTYLDVYDGKFDIQISFSAKRGIQKGLYQLPGKLRYQACDSARCLFPRTVEFLIDVNVR
jgi:thioredoxin:protein disulfide reductase